MKIKKTPGETVFNFLNVIFMILFCCAAIYPFLYLAARSLSSADANFSQITIIPQGFSWENYVRVFKNADIGVGFKNAILRTVVGTTVNVVFSILAAYPLSKKYYPNRSFWTGIIVFTMFFSGGMIPGYLLVKRLGLLNTMWAMILPGAINTYNMIIMRNFFMSLPDALEEAAKIDGAGDFRVLVSIMLPMSKPIIATIALWSMVGHWNAWFDCLIYITDPSKQVLQVIMRRIVLEGTSQMLNPNASEFTDMIVNPENIKASTIIVATLPIVMVYPFLQKYFVKGVLVGSLKG
ncbi:MAG: carbohydrate ABC transporter permease [Clostridia bacterium]|nr:carbohydrate ABC transporter permease [Clostridia bacterium]